MQIEKPVWRTIIFAHQSVDSSYRALDQWFEDNVAPLNKKLAEAKEIEFKQRIEMGLYNGPKQVIETKGERYLCLPLNVSDNDGSAAK